MTASPDVPVARAALPQGSAAEARDLAERASDLLASLGVPRDPAAVPLAEPVSPPEAERTPGFALAMPGWLVSIATTVAGWVTEKQVETVTERMMDMLSGKSGIEVDAKVADMTARLVANLDRVPTAAIDTGLVLFAKFPDAQNNPQIVVKRLTKADRVILNAHPEQMADPKGLLASLGGGQKVADRALTDLRARYAALAGSAVERANPALAELAHGMAPTAAGPTGGADGLTDRRASVQKAWEKLRQTRRP